MEAMTRERIVNFEEAHNARVENLIAAVQKNSTASVRRVNVLAEALDNFTDVLERVLQSQPSAFLSETAQDTQHPPHRCSQGMWGFIENEI